MAEALIGSRVSIVSFSCDLLEHCMGEGGLDGPLGWPLSMWWTGVPPPRSGLKCLELGRPWESVQGQ